MFFASVKLITEATIPSSQDSMTLESRSVLNILKFKDIVVFFFTIAEDPEAYNLNKC